ncbi:MAG: DnaD domain protein [Clostridia bacterium]|nr:DnaD domain protein [Clostridia bacterium]
MEIKIVPQKFDRIFALPKEITDNHLNFVSAEQIKAILLIYRNNGRKYFLSDLAKALKKSEDETKDIIEYWIENGFLNIDDEKINAKEIKTTEFVKKELPEIPYIQPTYDQVAVRLDEDENLKGLFAEAQKILGKTLGYDAQSKIIMMHDAYGLPVEVILSLISFSKNMGKSGINQICKIGRQWASDGILTLEDAIERMDDVKIQVETWEKFCQEFKNQNIRRTDNRVFLLIKWINEYKMSFDLIKYAFSLVDDTEHSMDFKYIDGILKDWHNKKIKTVDSAKKDNLIFKSKFQKGKTKTAQVFDTSYDLGKFADTNNKRKIKYKRRSN